MDLSWIIEDFNLIIASFAVCGLLYWFGSLLIDHSARRRKKYLLAIAEHYDGHILKDTECIKGTANGVEFLFEHQSIPAKTTSAEAQYHQWYVVETTLSPHLQKNELVISKKSLWKNTKHKLGPHIRIADESFDKMFMVKSTDAHWVRTNLSQKTMTKHLTLFNLRLEVQDGRLNAWYKYEQANTNVIEQVIELATLYTRDLNTSSMEELKSLIKQDPP